jgi:hypothetical protein
VELETALGGVADYASFDVAATVTQDGTEVAKGTVTVTRP